MENPTQPTSEHSANSAREKLRSYLGSQMKVVISDGRVLIGEFMCTDNDRNLILGNCDEYIPTSESVIDNNNIKGEEDNSCSGSNIIWSGLSPTRTKLALLLAK